MNFNKWLRIREANDRSDYDTDEKNNALGDAEKAYGKWDNAHSDGRSTPDEVKKRWDAYQQAVQKHKALKNKPKPNT